MEQRRELVRIAGLAWPVVLGQLGLVTLGMVDLVVVGALGPRAQAAVGLGNTWTFAGLILGIGVTLGLDPYITTAYGACRPRRAGRAALHGAILLAGVGLLIVVQHLLAGPALRALGQPADAIPEARLYAWIQVFGVPPFLAFLLLRQLLQGGGKMRPAMWVVGLGNGVNLAADWILVVKSGTGVAGVAWATVLVRWVMLGALLWLGRSTFHRAWPGWRVERQYLLAVVAMALPTGLQVGLEVWAFNTASLLAGWLGSAALAAHSAALTAASMAFMVPMGIGAAAATRVGNLVGAGLPWRRAAWTAIAMGATVMLLSGSLFAFAPHVVARIFTDDREVLDLMVRVLPVAAVFGFFDGTQAVAHGVLRGLRDTRYPALLALFAYWGIALPWGTSGLGDRGLVAVWEGLAAGLATAAVLLVVRIARTDPSPGT